MASLATNEGALCNSCKGNNLGVHFTRMLIVGHRGAPRLAQENSLASFRAAIVVGCSRVELDVRTTKDARLVVIHDRVVDRLTYSRGPVSAMTLLELQSLACRGGEPLASLDDVIALCKGKVKLQIEMKDTKTPSLLCRSIATNRIEDQVLVTSFNNELLGTIKRLNPAVKTGLLFRDYRPELWSFANDLDLAYICPHFNIVSKQLVVTAHSIGLRVYAFHVNAISIARQLESLGVDDVGTDIPDLLLDHMNNGIIGCDKQ